MQVEKVKHVREVLDQQVKLRAELREKTVKERVDFDKKLLENAKKELDIEAKQKANLQAKVVEQKRLRDQTMQE